MILKCEKREGVSFVLPEALTEKWNPNLKVNNQASNTIEILDVIGFDYWDDGITSKSISDKLNAMTGDVDVVINSPGGDMFEGIAIHNLLASYDKGNVNVKVLGIAASAASVIAMAGKNIQIAKSAFLMIHNAWTVARGDRHDFLEMSEYLKPFDTSMAVMYSDKTGIEQSEITTMMDKETWISGSEAVEKNFADSIMNDDPVESETEQALAAVREIENVLRKSGYSRTKTRALIKELKHSKSGAADENDKPSAVDMSETLNLVNNLKEVTSCRK